MVHSDPRIAIVEGAWEDRLNLSPQAFGQIPETVKEILEDLDRGHLRVAENINGTWHTHSWIKKAILLSFRLFDMKIMENGLRSYDKIPLKFTHWTQSDFQHAGIRLVPGAIVRYSAYLSCGTIVMPGVFINMGAYIGANTMVDSAVRVGSCAQIGSNSHLSDNVGIGGVLEPPQASPVIIEDNCFIGAACQIVEGVLVGTGSVLGAGVILTSSTKIVNRQTGDVTYGYIPPYSVVVPGSLPDPVLGKPSLSCAVIIKQVDEQTRLKTAPNELLR